jgi:single-strand DNA-binding protein
MSMNLVTLSGNLAVEPTSRTINEKPFVTARMAVRRNYKNADGGYDADFFNISAFGFAATRLQTAVVGSPIAVTGRLRQSTWKDKETDKNRESVEITVDEIVIGTKAPKAESTDSDVTATEAIAGGDW